MHDAGIAHVSIHRHHNERAHGRHDAGVGYYVLRKWAESGWLSRNIVIVGAGPQAKKLLERLDRIYEPWNVVVGVFDDRVNRTGPKVMGYPVLGTVDDLFTYAREHRVDDVIVSLPWSAEKRMPEIVSKLKELPVHIRLGSDMAGFMYPRGSYSVLGGVTTMDVVSKPLSGWKVVVKYLEDKILASLLAKSLASNKRFFSPPDKTFTFERARSGRKRKSCK